MSWFWFGVAATVGFALVNLADKILLLRFAKSDIGGVKILAIFNIVFFVSYLLLGGTRVMSSGIALAILGGIFEILYIYWYLKAIQKELVAYLIPFFALAPVGTLVLGFLFGGSIPQVIPVVGIFVTIVGIVFLTRAKEGSYKISDRRAVKAMCIATALFAIATFFVDRSLDTTSFFTLFAWSRLGVVLGAAALLVYKKEFHTRDLTATSGVFALTEVIYLGTNYLFFRALEAGDASLVLGVGNTQPFFVYVFSGILFAISPKILNEDFRFASPLGAVASICIIGVGSWMMQL